MTRQAVNRIGAIAPFVCSALALALVLANIAGGVRPAPDENASAHVFQLLIALQLPLVLLFLATADWKSRAPFLVLLLQAAAVAAALLPVWLAGY